MTLFSTASSTAQNALVSQAQQAGAKLQSKAEGALSKVIGGQSPQQLADAAKRLQKGGLTATDQSQIRNLAEAKLADTIFKTGPKDDLLAVDVYGISDNGILNNITDKLSGFAMGALDSFRKSTGLVTDLTSMIRMENGGFSFDKQALVDRVASAMGGTSNILRGMSGDLQTSLTQGYNVDPSILSQVQVVVGEATQSFSSGNLKDARGIFDLVNQISGDSQLSQFIDVGAQTNMLSGLFREAIQMGVPEAVEALANQAQYSMSADYALRGNIEVAVTMSDLDTTSLMVDKLGLNRVLADVPDAATRLASNYQLPDGIDNAGLDAEATKFTNTLSKLHPGWDSYNRDGTAVSDLSIYTALSQDARQLLGRDPDHQVAALIASSYQGGSMIDQVKTMYPYAVV